MSDIEYSVITSDVTCIKNFDYIWGEHPRDQAKSKYKVTVVSDDNILLIKVHQLKCDFE